MPERITGTVANWKDQEGYGFIDVPGSPNVFIHHTQINMDGHRQLEKGQMVEFEIGPGTQGRTQAMNLRVIDEG